MRGGISRRLSNVSRAGFSFRRYVEPASCSKLRRGGFRDGGLGLYFLELTVVAGLAILVAVFKAGPVCLPVFFWDVVRDVDVVSDCFCNENFRHCGGSFLFSLIIPEERACGAVSFSVGSGDRMGVMSVPELHGACTCPLWLGVSIKELL